MESLKHKLCLFCTKGPTWRATAPFIFGHHEESSNSQVFIIFLPEILLIDEIFVFLFLRVIGIEEVKKSLGFKMKEGEVLCIKDITHLVKKYRKNYAKF